jgi:hypothetical protein
MNGTRKKELGKKLKIIPNFRNLLFHSAFNIVLLHKLNPLSIMKFPIAKLRALAIQYGKDLWKEGIYTTWSDCLKFGWVKAKLYKAAFEGREIAFRKIKCQTERIIPQTALAYSQFSTIAPNKGTRQIAANRFLFYNVTEQKAASCYIEEVIYC